MNKKQNTKVDIPATVAAIQSGGIEVMAGFIFGCDEDTIETADAIATFATEVAIPTAMAGMLTPIPHTPLAERLRAEGRLHEAEYSGNNTDDEVQFQPRRMSVTEMQGGYYNLLKALFSSGAVYRRATALLDRLEPHIFFGGRSLRGTDVRAALRSLWLQGIVRAPRRDYLQLLWSAWRHDRVRLRSARGALSRLRQELRRLAGSPSKPTPRLEAATLLGLLGPAHDAVLRSQPSRPLDEVNGWMRSVRTRIDAGDASSEDLAALYVASREFFVRQRQLHRFPGAYLVKAFNLAIKGLHYERVTEDIVPQQH
jgi:hypothetical protein